MISKNWIQGLAKGVMASVVIFSMGTGTVFANDESTETSNVTVETGTTIEQEINGETTSTEGTSTMTQDSSEVIVSVEAPQNNDDSEQEDLVEPSLIPGDFFYFVKVMIEKVRLAVTVDDYKEAQLLADFAAERIAEANALLAEGKKEEAEQLLKEAISTQELAGETLPEAEVEVAEEVEASEPVVTEDEVELVAEETEVESKLAHNIDALLVVLEKMENPKAQQAIMKNIQKSFKKMDKKFKKLEEAEIKFAEKMTEIEEKLASGQISVEEADHKKTKLEVELSEKKQKLDEEEAKAVEKINKEVVEKTTKAINEQKKKEQEALKKAEKKKREEAKKAAEKQREAAKKAKGKKHDDDKDDDDHDDDDQDDDEDEEAED
jgi:hypothetical protein